MQYGDTDNVVADAKTLHEILARQGTDIFLEVLADHLGGAALKFNLSQADVSRVVTANTELYQSLVSERT